MEIIIHFFHFVGSWGWPILAGVDKSRLLEGFIFLIVCWRHVRPHLEKVESRLASFEDSFKKFTDEVTLSFSNGEARFKQHQDEIEKLKKLIEPKVQQINKAIGGENANNTSVDPSI